MQHAQGRCRPTRRRPTERIRPHDVDQVGRDDQGQRENRRIRVGTGDPVVGQGHHRHQRGGGPGSEHEEARPDGLPRRARARRSRRQPCAKSSPLSRRKPSPSHGPFPRSAASGNSALAYPKGKYRLARPGIAGEVAGVRDRAEVVEPGVVVRHRAEGSHGEVEAGAATPSATTAGPVRVGTAAPARARRARTAMPMPTRDAARLPRGRPQQPQRCAAEGRCSARRSAIVSEHQPPPQGRPQRAGRPPAFAQEQRRDQAEPDAGRPPRPHAAQVRTRIVPVTIDA